ncbi:DegV family protein [Anaerocolumna sp. MB42-C2]|uniref:DegV family protein n=1 Tax=Anaerocolumna sp. MB42-C2 TaxID=3070997 RepID=UPI0027DFC2EF|nr:DegV family protein [Anaerocolumna sp. MB42-C2]WMJ87588.1 DegV family protein [Anaerocolumna sp. MB42-C2]
MKDFVITADSNCDLLPEFIKEKNIGIIPHYYDIDGITYGDEINLTPKEFYDKMRTGFMPTTMASNPAVIRETFKNYVDQGLDVLHISFSSALSGGHSNVATGAAEICEENPGAKIIVLDSMNASMGEGLVIMKAVQLKEAGKGIDEIAEWIETHKLNFCVQFTVDDLFHLQRGGRVSKMTAIVGSMINVKPILVVNKEGALVPAGTVRGRKKSLATIVNNMENQIGSYKDEESAICVVHGDALEDAEYVAELIKEKLHTNHIIINTISPSIGAHSGPGAIGICYYGGSR